MEVIGAAFQRDVDGPAAGVPVLGIVGAGHDLEFLHRVHRRNVGHRAYAVVDGIVGRPVQQEFDRASDTSVDGPRSIGAVRERLLVESAAAGGSDAVCDCGQHDGVASIDGEVHHLTVVDHHAAIALLGVNQRGFRRNRDPVRLRANL